MILSWAVVVIDKRVRRLVKLFGFINLRITGTVKNKTSNIVKNKIKIKQMANKSRPEHIAYNKKMMQYKNPDCKYKTWHDSIINRAKNREKVCGEYYEFHHIIPKCCGGTDDVSNTVYLTAKEHVLVHKLLHEIYPKCPGIAEAVNAMALNKKGGREGEKRFSTREIAYYREQAAKAHRGRKMPEGFGQKIAEANRKRIVSNNQRQKMSNYMKNRKRDMDYLLNQSKGHKGQKAWNKGVPMTDEQKAKLSSIRKGKKPQKVVDPLGRIFPSLAKAGEANGLSGKVVKSLITKHPENGYRFLPEN